MEYPLFPKTRDYTILLQLKRAIKRKLLTDVHHSAVLLMIEKRRIEQLRLPLTGAFMVIDCNSRIDLSCCRVLSQRTGKIAVAGARRDCFPGWTMFHVMMGLLCHSSAPAYLRN